MRDDTQVPDRRPEFVVRCEGVDVGKPHATWDAALDALADETGIDRDFLAAALHHAGAPTSVADDCGDEWTIEVGQ